MKMIVITAENKIGFLKKHPTTLSKNSETHKSYLNR
jgi:hypothetical protein